ncbi:MAG: sensor histidine kinase [Lachnospiraceae bacterium]|nr:sensor histidine kinase [Lachnospiraceae bacterium]
MRRQWTIIAYALVTIGLIVWLTSLLETDKGTILNELDFVTYDDVLYSPEELDENPNLPGGHVGWDYSYENKEFAHVRTNVMDLDLVPGQTYGLYEDRLTYACNVYVDGELLVSLGKVSETAEGFVPCTAPVLCFFTAGEHTRIVVQHANFCHARWGIFHFSFGTQQEIIRLVQNIQIRNTSLIAALLTLGILNLGMFAGMRDRKRYAWFSLLCFFTVLYLVLTDPKLIMQMFPDLNWYLGHKLEGVALAGIGCFMYLFLEECFQKYTVRWVRVMVYVSMAAMAGFFLFLPSLVYTQYYVAVRIAGAVCFIGGCLVIILKALMHWKELSYSQNLYIGCCFLFMLAAIAGAMDISPFYLDLMRMGMFLLELFMTLTLAIEFRDVQEAYKASVQNEKQLRQMNENMEQTKEMQENFMAIMNHEMRTPLTVIAGYADLSAKNLEKRSDSDPETIRNLQLVKQEALRLGRIVEQTDEGIKTSVVSGTYEMVQILRLYEDVRDFCSPICEKRHNTIQIQCPNDLTMSCMRDTMLQLLYNLVLNASRHVEHGVVRLIAGEWEKEIVLRVEDNGEGMDDETIRRAFERGFTRDGRHGLGLALCREIAERHEGRIWIERNEAKGITMYVAIPKDRKGADGKA